MCLFLCWYVKSDENYLFIIDFLYLVLEVSDYIRLLKVL